MARPAKRSKATGADAAGEIRRKLAAGRSMSALKDAKDLVKRDGGPEALELLAAAYTARIADLRDSGMLVEATELVGVARAKFPELAARWDGASREVAHATGDLGDTLRRWAAEPSARDELTELLRRTTRDPAWIADSPDLPSDDPLRVAAGAVRDAFTQAAAGELSEAARDGLRLVGRRSPLVPWRAFVLAVDAFHSGADDRCRQALAGIRDDDATAPARDLLRAALLDAPPPRERTAARALGRLVGAVPAAKLAVERLGELHQRERAFEAAAVVVAREIAQLGRRPAVRFLRWVARYRDPEVVLTIANAAGMGPGWFGADHVRIVALLVPDDPVTTISGFGSWVIERRSRTPAPSAVEVGLVLERIAPTLDDFGAELREFFEADVLGAWTRGEPADAIVRAFTREFVVDGPLRQVVTAWEIWLELSEWLEGRTGVRRRGLPARVELLRQLVAVDPTPARFVDLVGRLGDEADATVLVEVLERWAAACPDDPEPWLRRGEMAARRAAFEEADRHLEAAERLAPADPRIRAARTRAALDSLAAARRHGKPQACRDALARLGALPVARRPWIAEFLGVAADHLQVPDAVPGPRPALARDEQRTLAALVDSLLKGIEPKVFGSDRAARLARAARIGRIAAELGGPLRGLPHGVGRLTDLDPAELPDGDEELLALCELCEPSQGRVRALATGVGIRRETPLLARFLAHRALSLPRNYSARIETCARLAAHFAPRFGDLAAQRLVAPLLHDPSGARWPPLDDAAARAMLERERVGSDWVKTSKRRGGGSGAAAQSVQRDLFDAASNDAASDDAAPDDAGPDGARPEDHST